METIDDLNKRICQLEQELIGLKKRRNALTPINKLPIELVVRIAEATCVPGKFPRTTVAMTLACTRLREVLVNTQQLWETMNLSLPWPPSAVRCFFAWARSHTLRLTLDGSRDSFNSYQQTIKALARAEGFQFSRIQDRLNKRLIDLEMFGMIEAASLQTLLFENAHFWSDFLNPRFLQMVQCSNLRSLEVTRMDPISKHVSRFPHLRRPIMRNSLCPFDNLHRFLSQTTCLEHLSLHDAVGQIAEREVDHSAQTLHLPNLRHLDMKDDMKNVAQLLIVCPNPSSRLVVHVSEDDNDCSEQAEVWTSSAGLVGLIATRVHGFWRSHTCGDQTAPKGCVRFMPLVYHNALELAFDTPELLYRHDTGCRIEQPDPLLAQIKSLVVDFDDDDDDMTLVHSFTDHLDVHYLPCLEHVEIRQANLNGSGKMVVKEVESWIGARCLEGRPLRSVHFEACESSAKEVYLRMVEQGMASEVL
jgi:hypothetical protein